MKSRIISFLLLLSLFFNVAHASIIVSEAHYIHESISEHMPESDHTEECDTLCHFHDLFHLSAIIIHALQFVPTPRYSEQPNTKLLTYHPPFQKNKKKPPIA
ncbi:hypothetical protein ACM66Z_06555 [Sulfurovum sp. ST-21]|uniref:Cobalt transporter n=1 Tax=Sulfurovum indicum TaxID=2779528 RepID=A0A7M1S1K7_9BACT|nr:hypothetical protein [Sulfurovum indicum]QOR61114.1 hypothetical protein IMZ28_06510 [Sulfurovum indicum]